MTGEDHTAEAASRAMIHLAKQLPSLAHIERWDPCGLEQWARGPVHVQALHAARFVCGVWDPQRPSWRFDLMEALDTFDHAHGMAVAKWVMAPWYPRFVSKR